MNLYLVSVALLILHFAALSILVSVLRVRERTMFGSSLDIQSWLYRSMRAQGNAAEYLAVIVPVLLFFSVAHGDLLAWWFAPLVVATRVLHSLGILLASSMSKPHVFRAIAGGVTYFILIRMGIVLMTIAMG